MQKIHAIGDSIDLGVGAFNYQIALWSLNLLFIFVII
jgi:hypothetical protein